MERHQIGARFLGKQREEEPKLPLPLRLRALLAIAGGINPDSVKRVQWNGTRLAGVTTNGGRFSIGF